MSPEEKLEELYAIKDKLHPLAMILIVGFKETQKGVLNIHDIQFIESMYPHYLDKMKIAKMQKELDKVKAIVDGSPRDVCAMDNAIYNLHQVKTDFSDLPESPAR